MSCTRLVRLWCVLFCPPPPLALPPSVWGCRLEDEVWKTVRQRVLMEPWRASTRCRSHAVAGGDALLRSTILWKQWLNPRVIAHTTTEGARCSMDMDDEEPTSPDVLSTAVPMMSPAQLCVCVKFCRAPETHLLERRPRLGGRPSLVRVAPGVFFSRVFLSFKAPHLLIVQLRRSLLPCLR